MDEALPPFTKTGLSSIRSFIRILQRERMSYGVARANAVDDRGALTVVQFLKMRRIHSCRPVPITLRFHDNRSVLCRLFPFPSEKTLAQVQLTHSRNRNK